MRLYSCIDRSLAAEATVGYEWYLPEAERLSKRMELRLKESEEKEHAPFLH